MARDFAGRSDPFVVLDLTGRWASHLVNLESNLAILQKRSLLGTAYAGNSVYLGNIDPIPNPNPNHRPPKLGFRTLYHMLAEDQKNPA